jgi:hypothetical protein
MFSNDRKACKSCSALLGIVRHVAGRTGFQPAHDNKQSKDKG